MTTCDRLWECKGCGVSRVAGAVLRIVIGYVLSDGGRVG